MKEGVADVHEHRDRHGEQEIVGDVHVRSITQMSPNIASVNPTMPRRERKSAMTRVW